jgi:hypothetical protein
VTSKVPKELSAPTLGSELEGIITEYVFPVKLLASEFSLLISVDVLPE